MVTIKYKREHFDDYNDIHDILSSMPVDSIADRQHVFIIYPTTMIKREVWIFSHCMG